MIFKLPDIPIVYFISGNTTFNEFFLYKFIDTSSANYTLEIRLCYCLQWKSILGIVSAVSAYSAKFVRWTCPVLNLDQTIFSFREIEMKM